ncbi:25S rRNA (adenine2142-N1)-methyltransferase [Savitreella phatthalungensis]
MPKGTKAKPITQRGRNHVGSTKRSGGSAGLTGNKLIRRYHTLQKDLAAARRDGDTVAANAIDTELEGLGGLEAYQAASIQGQDKRFGGDSSKELVKWLSEEPRIVPERRLTRVLEIGCLRVDNYISRMAGVQMTRIDLHSQHKEILEQDFLARPAPRSVDETFHGISCSLVLNFVPVHQRGDFLIHLTRFLRSNDRSWLFFVLPAPCVDNSRYLDLPSLKRMFGDLGFDVVREKSTPRMLYLLLVREREDVAQGIVYRKKELRAGASRNNFWIPLKT